MLDEIKKAAEIVFYFLSSVYLLKQIHDNDEKNNS